MMQSPSKETVLRWLPALLAALLAWLVAAHVYFNRPLTTDENSYLFQAQNFIEGRIARPMPDIARAFFHYMIITDPEVGWLSRYPPGHPLWLVPGVLVGYPRLMSLFGAALGILMMGAITRRLACTAPLAAWMLVLSPFYIFMYGSLLSHTSGFVFTALLLLAYIQWHQTGRLLPAALAGVGWGLLFLNRTYTAALLVLPFGLHAVITFLVRRDRRSFAGCTVFAAVSAVFYAAFRLYNKAAVGSSRLTTFLFYDPSEGLGFGRRHTGGLVVNHTFERGVRNLYENLLLMDRWVWGFTGGLILLVLLACIGWRKRWTPLLLAAPLFIWGGYVYFWYPGIEHFRPVYSFEALVFLIPAAACGAQRLWDRLERRPRLRAGVFSLALLALPLAGSPFTLSQVRFFQNHNRAARAVYDILRTAPPRSLVVLQGFGRKEKSENMLNMHGLDSDPLVVRGNPYWNDAVVALHSERTPFLATPDAGGLQPYPRRKPIRYTLPALHTHYRVGGNLEVQPGHTVRFANAGSAPGLLLFGRYPYLTPGTWSVTLHFSAEDIDPALPLRFEVASDRGRAIETYTAISGSHPHTNAVLTVTTPELLEIEPRIHYGGSGSVWIERITVEQQ